MSIVTLKRDTSSNSLGHRTGDSALQIAEPLADSTPQDFGLSTRENEVLVLIAEGLADKEIALSLGMSPYTVNKHVGAILRKLNVASRTQAAVRALRFGLIP